MSDNDNIKRNASDILLELENKINNLISTVNLCNANNQFILNTVNTLRKELVMKEHVDMKKDELYLNISKELIEIKKPTDMAQTTSVIAAKNMNKSMIKVNENEKSDKKIPIIQKITDEFSKDIFMADISIMDEEKNIVAKSKTNAVGKYTASLKPGKYTVRIIKTDTVSKKKFEAEQMIEIENSNAPLTLSNFILKRK
jgi:hypothetical protein